MRLYLNRFEARDRLRPRAASHKGLGPRPRFVVLCSYSPFRPEVCRLWARSYFRARWLARSFLLDHPFGEAVIRERA